uniref:Uncharacterized protein n=1 Tax=Arundo donax TaxID=35708 RepID=A0A0A9FEA0_ARUDO
MNIAARASSICKSTKNGHASNYEQD